MKYQTELTLKNDVAEGTMQFHFKKPDGFVFKAGQFMDVTIINPPETDAEGNTRAFSIVASPDESDLQIATRMRDTAFKRTLKGAAVGMQIEIDGPMGSFTLHENVTKPAICLVGGIGITPFMSIVKDATKRGLPHKINLFYSNRRPEDAAFLGELQELAAKNPNFKFIPTMTLAAESAQKWAGETGYISKEMMDKYTSERTNAVYYAAGPQAMVAAMRKILNDMGVSDDDIKTEEFSGY